MPILPFHNGLNHPLLNPNVFPIASVLHSQSHPQGRANGASPRPPGGTQGHGRSKASCHSRKGRREACTIVKFKDLGDWTAQNLGFMFLSSFKNENATLRLGVWFVGRWGSNGCGRRVRRMCTWDSGEKGADARFLRAVLREMSPQWTPHEGELQKLWPEAQGSLQEGRARRRREPGGCYRPGSLSGR